MTLFVAMVLDAVLGEPDWLWKRLPHPAVLMGRAVGRLDQRLNSGANRRAKGIAALLILIVAAGLTGFGLAALPGHVAEVVVAAILLAQRSLVDHVAAVGTGLRSSLAEGRGAVAMIVSRDTRTMEDTAVARSAIESGAENLSDGVIAPAFWFAVAGLPGLLIYKVTNTADSMIGYRTPRHIDLGWASARFDDLLNLVPARLTALLLWLAGGSRGGWRGIIADARLHKSPNAGWPEAALSRALGVSLAGPRSYDGELRDFPYVNAVGRAPRVDDIFAATRIMWGAWALALVGAFVIGLA